MSDAAVRAGVCRLSLSNGRWLGTAVNGGFREADSALNITVPAEFDRRDLEAVVVERSREARFDADGPALLTAVEQRHARAARAQSVTVVATAGLSNPATLPIEPSKVKYSADERPPVGTVNLLVSTERFLSDSQLAGALASVVEAKTATLQALTGFTGTTSDAVAVGSTRDGRSVSFVGSSTEIGRALRACVRDAIVASLEATYADEEIPSSVEDAEHGAVTECETTVFTP